MKAQDIPVPKGSVSESRSLKIVDPKFYAKKFNVFNENSWEDGA